MRAHPIGMALNEKPKYVASTTLDNGSWPGTTVLSGDLSTAVGELKERPGGELQVHGSGGLIRSLLEYDLIDEMTLLTVPVVLGQGKRLFAEDGLDHELDLVESWTDAKGVIAQIYRPGGRPTYHPAFADEA